MEGRLSDIVGSSSDDRSKISSIKSLVDSVQSKAAELCELVTFLTTHGDLVPQQVVRPVMVHVSDLLTHLAQQETDRNVELIKQVAQCGLDSLKDHRAANAEADRKMREVLGAILSEEESFLEAARVLAGIDCDESPYTDAEKAEHYVKVTELFLEEDEVVDAERFVGRASGFVLSAPQLVQVRHKVCYARILDSKRKFLEAAHRYYQLSTNTLMPSGGNNPEAAKSAENEPTFVREEDLLHLLMKAVTCALLAAAGPQRDRMLNLLYKDERTMDFSTHWPVLEKMYRERILTKPEVRAFEQALEPHQKAILADGSSVLERAVIEHNVIATSKIYGNITFDELSQLLEIDASQAEVTVQRMIKENRLVASIDQVDRLVEFESDPSQLMNFDRRIQEFCNSTNQVLASIMENHPIELE